MINHYQPLSTIINHYQPSLTIINGYQPLLTIINHSSHLLRQALGRDLSGLPRPRLAHNDQDLVRRGWSLFEEMTGSYNDGINGYSYIT